jgi:hypothetical protein
LRTRTILLFSLVNTCIDPYRSLRCNKHCSTWNNEIDGYIRRFDAKFGVCPHLKKKSRINVIVKQDRGGISHLIMIREQQVVRASLMWSISFDQNKISKSLTNHIAKQISIIVHNAYTTILHNVK